MPSGIIKFNRTRERKPLAPNQSASSPSSWDLLRGLGAIGWCFVACALSTRHYYVLGYQSQQTLPGWLEPLAADGSVLVLSMLLASLWYWWSQPLQASVLDTHRSLAQWRLRSHSALWIAQLPLLLVGLRTAGFSIPVSFFEPIWFATWTGISVSLFDRWNVDPHLQSSRLSFLVSPRIWMTGVVVFGVIWFWMQSRTYHSNFMLGFNDFGHFTQRIANTAAGRNFLLETDVLPPFWDHFNPALLLWVPMWRVFPDVNLMFLTQAFCLAGCGALVYRLAKELGCTSMASSCWGMAWVFHPSASQMNIAYTYGWHPVSLALPLLLGWLCVSLINTKSLLLSGKKKSFLLAIEWTIVLLACCVEENVIVVLALWFGGRAVRLLLVRSLPPFRTVESTSWLDSHRGPLGWGLGGLLLAVLFVIVYRYSGLAPFQTSRFVDLGSNPWQILISPIAKPMVFWGRIFEFRSWIFLCCILLPLFPWRSWRAYGCWLPTVIPFVVLLVWNHVPAKSLAFQYVTTLLPFLFLSGIVASLCQRLGEEPGGQVADEPSKQGEPMAAGALAACFVLSIFVGQWPWSSQTIVDVEAQTYAPSAEWRRLGNSEDGKWLEGELKQIRKSQSSVLATGRIASHLIGCEHLETIGQFHERRDKLQACMPANQSVLERYEWIILDRQERFQQSKEQIEKVELEARRLGFQVEQDRYDVVFLRRSKR